MTLKAWMAQSVQCITTGRAKENCNSLLIKDKDFSGLQIIRNKLGAQQAVALEGKGLWCEAACCPTSA